MHMEGDGGIASPEKEAEDLLLPLMKSIYSNVDRCALRQMYSSFLRGVCRTYACSFGIARRMIPEGPPAVNIVFDVMVGLAASGALQAYSCRLLGIRGMAVRCPPASRCFRFNWLQGLRCL